MAVTNIKGIRNRTPFWVAFRKLEDPQKNVGKVAPGESLAHEIWIPWVNDGLEFAKKVLIVDVNQRWRAYIWQKGDYIFYRRGPASGPETGFPYHEPPRTIVQDVPLGLADSKYFVEGVPIPGVSVIRGDRILTIHHIPGRRLPLTSFFDVSLTAI